MSDGETNATATRKRGLGEMRMDPQGLFMKVPPDPALEPLLTSTDDHFTLAHLGIVHTSADSWKLEITDMSGKSRRLTLSDLRALPSRTLTVLMECSGNPEDPDKPLRIVSNATWHGVAISDLFTGMRNEGASHLWLRGEDWGSYAGEQIEGYIKDVPIAKAMNGDALIAYEMNGSPLTPEHGFPLRAVIPGYYGTNSVKWLSSVSLHASRPDGMFTTRRYNWIEDGGETKPVWEILVNSRLLAPTSGATWPRGEVAIYGRAWGHAAIARVEYSIDGGTSWKQAGLDSRTDYAWQPFKASWQQDKSGALTISVRATDVDGHTQPETLHINRIHQVQVTVD